MRQRSMWIDDDLLALGFPATTDHRPLSTVDKETLRSLGWRAIDGEAILGGGWTLIGKRPDRLIVRTDPYGSRPLFWTHSDTETKLSEEIWPLVSPKTDIDAVGVADFLLLGQHVADRTIFRDVFSSQAHSRLTLKANGEVERSLFFYPESARVGPTLDDAISALEIALSELYLPYSDVKHLLMPLSGGLDSRVLLCLALEHGFRVHAWTFAMRPGTVEESIARRVATTLGVDHTVSIRDKTDLRKNAAAFVRATSGQLSLEHAHVYGSQWEPPREYDLAVNGIYGDAFCGGSFLLAPGQNMTELRKARLDWLLGGRPLPALQERLPGLPFWSERLQEQLTESFARAGSTPRRADLAVLCDRPGRFNVWGSIAVLDRYDFIAPFLNNDLIGVCYGMDEQWQRESIAYRKVIAKRWPSVTSIPWAKTGLPVNREAGRALRLRRRIQRRMRIPTRAMTFTDVSIYAEAFQDLSIKALEVLTKPLADIGIDLPGLADDYPVQTPHGRDLRLRAASCLLALREAGSEILLGK